MTPRPPPAAAAPEMLAPFDLEERRVRNTAIKIASTTAPAAAPMIMYSVESSSPLLNNNSNARARILKGRCVREHAIAKVGDHQP